MQFETLEQATAALEGTKDTPFNGRRLTVEYVAPNAPRPPPKHPVEPPRHRDAYGGRPSHRDYDAYGPPRGVYAPHVRAVRDDYVPRYERAAMPARRMYERDDYMVAPGRLERSRAPPMHRGYMRDEPPMRRYIEVPYEPEMYEPRRMLPRRDETFVRKSSMYEDSPTRYDAGERYEGGDRVPGRYAPRRSDYARGYRGTQNESGNRGARGSISPDRMAADSVSPRVSAGRRGDW